MSTLDHLTVRDVHGGAEAANGNGCSADVFIVTPNPRWEFTWAIAGGHA